MYFHDSLIDLLFFLLHISHALCILRFLRPRADKVSPSLYSSSLNNIELNSGALPLGCLTKYVSRSAGGCLSPSHLSHIHHLCNVVSQFYYHYRYLTSIHFKQILITGQIYWRFQLQPTSESSICSPFATEMIDPLPLYPSDYEIRRNSWELIWLPLIVVTGRMDYTYPHSAQGVAESISST